MTYVTTSYRTTQRLTLRQLAFTPLIVSCVSVFHPLPAAKCSMCSYTIEIFPFALRAKGFMLFHLTLSISVIFNQ